MPELHLLVFGMGYTGRAIAAAAAMQGWAVSGTSRTPGQVPPIPGVAVIPFAEAGPAVSRATHLVATAAPSADHDGQDPVLARYAHAVEASAPRWIGYLSTTGIYGDRGGGWVDEDTPPDPTSERAQRRIAAEDAWRVAAGARPLDIFRLAGIYGPGRSVLDDLRAGTARRVVRPGHAFGRIHRDDIAAAVLAAMNQDRPGGTRVLNLVDDEPAEQAAVVEEAARLLGVSPPRAVPFAEAEPGMSPMARSFWADNRRVSGAKTQQALGLRWRYPTYREGLRATLAEQVRDHGSQQVQVGPA